MCLVRRIYDPGSGMLPTMRLCSVASAWATNCDIRIRDRFTCLVTLDRARLLQKCTSRTLCLCLGSPRSVECMVLCSLIHLRLGLALLIKLLKVLVLLLFTGRLSDPESTVLLCVRTVRSILLLIRLSLLVILVGAGLRLWVICSLLEVSRIPSAVLRRSCGI